MGILEKLEERLVLLKSDLVRREGAVAVQLVAISEVEHCIGLVNEESARIKAGNDSELAARGGRPLLEDPTADPNWAVNAWKEAGTLERSRWCDGCSSDDFDYELADCSDGKKRCGKCSEDYQAECDAKARDEAQGVYRDESGNMRWIKGLEKMENAAKGFDSSEDKNRADFWRCDLCGKDSQSMVRSKSNGGKFCTECETDRAPVPSKGYGSDGPVETCSQKPNKPEEMAQGTRAEKQKCPPPPVNACKKCGNRPGLCECKGDV